MRTTFVPVIDDEPIAGSRIVGFKRACDAFARRNSSRFGMLERLTFSIISRKIKNRLWILRPGFAYELYGLMQNS
jgi:hypothetical protein